MNTVLYMKEALNLNHIYSQINDGNNYFLKLDHLKMKELFLKVYKTDVPCMNISHNLT